MSHIRLNQALFAATTALIVTSVAPPSHAASTNYGDTLCETTVSLPIERNETIAFIPREWTVEFYTTKVDNQLIGTIEHIGQNDVKEVFNYPDDGTFTSQIDRYLGHTESTLRITGINAVSAGGFSNPWYFKWGIRLRNQLGVIMQDDDFTARCKFNQVVNSPGHVVLFWNLTLKWR